MKKNIVGLAFLIVFFNTAMAEQVADNQSAVVPITDSLKTETGNEIGISFTDYNYWEPNQSVNDTGSLYGLEYERTQAFDEFFIIGDVIYKQGSLFYNSRNTGSASGQNTHYYDIRGLIGKDYSFNSYNISPFIGIGYRNLYNDARGLSSTHSAGYQRTISYTYIPVGLIHRTLLQDAKLETRVEYDYLLSGTVNSNLSDTIGYNSITAYPDASNTQKSGWGFRLSSSYQKSSWALTPYFNYWFIQNSDIVYGKATIAGVTYSGGVLEPTNTTVEYGIKVSYKF
jgi:hypothetical protein